MRLCVTSFALFGIILSLRIILLTHTILFDTQTLILDTLETKGRDFAVLTKLVEEIFTDEKSGLTKGDVEAGLRLVYKIV